MEEKSILYSNLMIIVYCTVLWTLNNVYLARILNEYFMKKIIHTAN